jgi:hypothetical protein
MPCFPRIVLKKNGPSTGWVKGAKAGLVRLVSSLIYRKINDLTPAAVITISAIPIPAVPVIAVASRVLETPFVPSTVTVIAGIPAVTPAVRADYLFAAAKSPRARNPIASGVVPVGPDIAFTGAGRHIAFSDADLKLEWSSVCSRRTCSK